MDFFFLKKFFKKVIIWSYFHSAVRAEWSSEVSSTKLWAPTFNLHMLAEMQLITKLLNS